MTGISVAVQLRELLLSVAVGAALGLFYDLLRPLRRGKLLTALTDLLFCACNLLTLLAFALYVGRGRLRIFAVIGIVGGMSAWFWIWSAPFRKAQGWLLGLLTKPLRAASRKVVRGLKKFFGFCKKHVAFAEKNDKINNNGFAGHLRKRKGGCQYEIQKNVPARETADSGSRHFCHHPAGQQH